MKSTRGAISWMIGKDTIIGKRAKIGRNTRTLTQHFIHNDAIISRKRIVDRQTIIGHYRTILKLRDSI